MAVLSRLNPSTGQWQAYRTPSQNYSSGEIFSWRSVTRAIEDVLHRIREEASTIIYAHAQAAAREASSRYPARFRNVIVKPVSKYRARVTVVNRRVNFFDFGQGKGGPRRTSLGKARGQVTPSRVMGAVAQAHRARMVADLDALVERERTREI